MSPARSIIDRAFLVLLLLVSWSHRRSTCTHRKRLWPWLANNFGSVEAFTSPCAEERAADQRRAAGNGHLTATSEGSVHCLNCLVSDMYRQRCLDSAEESSWQHDGPRYWTRRRLSWWNSVARHLDQNNACLDTDSDAHCRGTPHGTVAPTALEDLLLLRLAGGNMVAPTSTAKQLGRNDGGMDSSTQGQLPARQPDCNGGTDVSMAHEQTTRQPGGNDETRSLPWWLIPGFKFLPTDHELVLHYLKHKVLNLGLPEHNAVREGEDVYGLNAAEITLDVNNRDKEMLGFFFVRKEEGQTYSNGCFYTTQDGYWKVRGWPAPIKHGGRVIAFKTSLDYYHGRTPHGCRTPWSMFEYALNTDQLDLRNLEQPSMNSYVVCKVRKREGASVRAKKWSGLPIRYRLKKRVRKNRALEAKAAARRRGGGVSGIFGKRKRSNMF